MVMMLLMVTVEKGPLCEIDEQTGIFRFLLTMIYFNEKP